MALLLKTTAHFVLGFLMLGTVIYPGSAHSAVQEDIKPILLLDGDLDVDTHFLCPRCSTTRLSESGEVSDGNVLVRTSENLTFRLDHVVNNAELDGSLSEAGEVHIGHNMPARRTPALAFGMSAVVPGLGQAYNKSWIRAAVAASLEIAFWTGSIAWRNQGNDGVDAYQVFAQQNWSPAQYAEFLNAYPGYTGNPINTTGLDGIDFTRSESWSAEEQIRVESFFEELRAAERASNYINADGTGTGASFSHTLHTFGHQQYYELIGKYYQYGPGWSDWCEGRPEDDPSCFTIEGAENTDRFMQKTDLFFEYGNDHAEANSLLRRASRMTSLIVANHALAALDALLTARFHNRNLSVETNVSLRTDASGRATPVANVSFRF